MIWSDRDIKMAIENGSLKVESQYPLYIGSSSLDLHLSKYAKILDKENGIVDVKDKNTIKYKEIEFDEIIIEPKEFYLLATDEKITLDKKTVAFVQGRSSIGRLGIKIHAAGYVDSGFSGTITLEVINMTSVPVKIYVGLRICQLVLSSTKSESEIGYGDKKDSKYQKQTFPEMSKIYEDL